MSTSGKKTGATVSVGHGSPRLTAPLFSPRVYPAFLPLIEGDQTGDVERGINLALGSRSHPPSQGQKPRPAGRSSSQWKAQCRHLHTVKITIHKWRLVASSVVALGRRERRARPDPPKGNDVRWASERERTPVPPDPSLQREKTPYGELSRWSVRTAQPTRQLHHVTRQP